MPPRVNALICTCTNCISNGSLKIKDALEEEIRKRGLEEDVLVVPTGASGLCVRGPILIVQPDGIFYQRLAVKHIPRLVEEHFLKGRPVEALMYTPPGEKVPIPELREIPFFREQRLIALRNRGMIDPDKIEEYIARDGYKALEKVLTSMTPQQVIDEVKKSGLRGRGGAGFPTGRKWESRARVKDTPKYVICNADEGDPGAFMDRSIIESDPHSVIEGMAIGAYAVGASSGYVYVRMEYPLAVERMRTAIGQAREFGLLGKDIFGCGFDFDVRIFRGAGAFVCGETTALVASIEGRPPEPRQRPPRTELWNKPTVINNVETWANVPAIINWGADWYAQVGTEKSKGTKVFSLAGNIVNAGLVEVPMGITLREIVYKIGGGVPDGRNLKAVQTGGPSGGFIPASLLDLPVDYERLQEAGAIMGSGGMIVMDEDSCIVDVAKYFLAFTNDESCGKCTSCREGSEALYRILDRISRGEGQEGDIELLKELGEAVRDASLCGLGQSLPNPVLSAVDHFRNEFESHIRDKVCPAGVCKALFQYEVDEEKCTRCGLCKKNCAYGAVEGEPKSLHRIAAERCSKCGACYEVCPSGAVVKVPVGKREALTV
jgi:NADP-reducing hydrogenase subunit HndC